MDSQTNNDDALMRWFRAMVALKSQPIPPHADPVIRRALRIEEDAR